MTVDAEGDRGRGVAESLLDDSRMDCPFENGVGSFGPGWVEVLEAGSRFAGVLQRVISVTPVRQNGPRTPSPDSRATRLEDT